MSKELKIPCKECITYAICRIKLMKHYEEYTGLNLKSEREIIRKSYAAWKMTQECEMLEQFYPNSPPSYLLFVLFDDMVTVSTNE